MYGQCLTTARRQPLRGPAKEDLNPPGGQPCLDTYSAHKGHWCARSVHVRLYALRRASLMG